MKKTKTQKGITLIALIITVIVLLILAVVSIKTIQNNGIIERANATTTRYEEESEKEGDVLQSYQNVQNEYSNKYGEGTKIEDTDKSDTSTEDTNTGNDSDINDDEWTRPY